MAIDEIGFGELIATVKNSAKDIDIIKVSTQKILENQATTEERLKHGNKRFENYDKKFEEVDKELDAKAPNDKFEEARVILESKASSKNVYATITIGFTVLAALITIYKFL